MFSCALLTLCDPDRRLSISEGFGLRRAESKGLMTPPTVYLTVVECEAKNVLDPLFWKVKFEGSNFTSDVSVSAKWNEWASGVVSKESVRVSLWSNKEGQSKTKLGYYELPLATISDGRTRNEWVQLSLLDGKTPAPGLRLHLIATTDSSIASHDRSSPGADIAAARRLSTELDAVSTSSSPSPSGSLRRPSSTKSTDDIRRPSLSVNSPLLGGVLRRDTSAIRELLKGREGPVLEREAQWRKFFELPEADLLVGDWSAAFMKGVARHGRLFVFTDHLCFHSNLFGVKTVFTIPFVDVIGVEKTVENLTPGIRVRTYDKTYNFGGIYARVKCHEMITSIWKGSYVLVDDATAAGADASAAADEAAAEHDQEMLEEQFPEELLSSKDYEKDGFLGGVDELSELLQEDMPVTPTRFFQLFVSNESTFEKDYHEARGDTDVKVEPWSPHETFGTTRNVFYVLKLSGPIGPPTTRTKEVHRYHLQKDRLIIDTSMNMLDAPYGDYFRVESQWMINLNPDGQSSHVRISAKAVFMKSTMMKGTISSRTLAGMTESFKFWISKARDLIAKKSPKKNSVSGDAGAAAAAAGASSDGVSVSSSSTAMSKPAASRGGGGGGVGIGSIIGALGGGLGALLSRDSLTYMSSLLNLVVQVLLVYVLIQLINRM